MSDIFPVEVSSRILKFLEHPVASIIKDEKVRFYTCRICKRFIFPRRRAVCDSCERSICLDCEVIYTSWEDGLLNCYDDQLCEDCFEEHLNDEAMRSDISETDTNN